MPDTTCEAKGFVGVTDYTGDEASCAAKLHVAVQPTTVIGAPRRIRVLDPRPIEGTKHGVARQ